MLVGMFIALICLAGGLGGVINALVTDNGFFMPRAEKVKGGAIIRMGFLTNILVGAAAGFVTWAATTGLVIGMSPTSPNDTNLPISALGNAVLVGIAGARVISSEIDKRLLKATAHEAAKSSPSHTAADQILEASPAQALEIAHSMN